MGRRSQVVKAAVCKTAIHRFESGRRLQIFSGSAIFYLAVEAFLYIFVLVLYIPYYFNSLYSILSRLAILCLAHNN